jgi:hypothetical protein
MNRVGKPGTEHFGLMARYKSHVGHHWLVFKVWLVLAIGLFPPLGEENSSHTAMSAFGAKQTLAWS